MYGSKKSTGMNMYNDTMSVVELKQYTERTRKELVSVSTNISYRDKLEMLSYTTLGMFEKLSVPLLSVFLKIPYADRCTSNVSIIK